CPRTRHGFRAPREPRGRDRGFDVGRHRGMSSMAVTRTLSPPPILTERFSDAVAAVDRLTEIYERNTAFLRERFQAYANGELLDARVRAVYPFVRITTHTHSRLDSRLAYGFVAGPGVHETTATRPDLCRESYIEQIGLLLEIHGVTVQI